MKIVFNTKSLLNAHQQDNYFLHESIKRLIKKYPEHEFTIMTDPADVHFYQVGKNVTAIITRQPLRYILLRKLWFDFKLPAILKKCKADVFVSADIFCSLATSLPQCLLLQNLTFLYDPNTFKKSTLFFYNRYLPDFLRKATTIATGSSYLKKDLSLRYKIAEEKIDVIVPAGREAFLPIDEIVKEEIKRKYCEGKSYFIYTQGVHSKKSLMTLLKAFSIFKKRQKSNWKLVVTGSTDGYSNSFTENLKAYKYRDDLVLTGVVEEGDLVELIGSAYALIHSNQWDGISGSLLEAMNCHIPVIASADSFTKEIAVDAALYTNTDDHTDIAEKMMLLYKDESLRNRLVEKGQSVVEKYNWDKTADALWKTIQKASASAGKTQR
jgi:glycosyltransferase involved in cell wall biosynthesis